MAAWHRRGSRNARRHRPVVAACEPLERRALLTVRPAVATVPVPPQAAASAKGTVTIPGGWWTSFADNLRDGASVLAPVANFGVGFDRSGLGTSSTTDAVNQSDHAFLDLAEMRAGCLGLEAVDRGVLETASGTFAAGFFVNPFLPAGVTNVAIR